ncbi:unnamed protein product [Lampetra fluviatilis]
MAGPGWPPPGEVPRARSSRDSLLGSFHSLPCLLAGPRPKGTAPGLISLSPLVPSPTSEDGPSPDRAQPGQLGGRGSTPGGSPRGVAPPLGLSSTWFSAPDSSADSTSESRSEAWGRTVRNSAPCASRVFSTHGEVGSLMVELGSLAELNGVSLFVDECHVAGAVAGAEGQCPDPRAAPRSPTPPPTSSAACRPPCSRREHGSGSSSTRSRESGVGGGARVPDAE